ncbi:unnamed protein product [Closterium sp. NIES-54]
MRHATWCRRLRAVYCTYLAQRRHILPVAACVRGHLPRYLALHLLLDNAAWNVLPVASSHRHLHCALVCVLP